MDCKIYNAVWVLLEKKIHHHHGLTPNRRAMLSFLWLVQRSGLEVSGSFIIPAEAYSNGRTLIFKNLTEPNVEEKNSCDMDTLSIFARYIIDEIARKYGQLSQNETKLESIIHSLPEWEKEVNAIVDPSKVFIGSTLLMDDKQSFNVAKTFFEENLNIRKRLGIGLF